MAMTKSHTTVLVSSTNAVFYIAKQRTWYIPNQNPGTMILIEGNIDKILHIRMGAKPYRLIERIMKMIIKDHLAHECHYRITRYAVNPSHPYHITYRKIPQQEKHPVYSHEYHGEQSIRMEIHPPLEYITNNAPTSLKH